MAKQTSNRRSNGDFAPGNTEGNRFAPGQSGNPNGRPRTKPLTDALKELLAANDEAGVKELVEVGYKAAKKGDFRFWKEIMDRMDGKVSESLDVTTQGQALDPVAVFRGVSADTRRRMLKDLGGPGDE